jgi:hypothetical protein
MSGIAQPRTLGHVPISWNQPVRHARACPGHPCLSLPHVRSKTWVPGTRPGMTTEKSCVNPTGVSSRRLGEVPDPHEVLQPFPSEAAPYKYRSVQMSVTWVADSTKAVAGKARGAGPWRAGWRQGPSHLVAALHFLGVRARGQRDRIAGALGLLVVSTRLAAWRFGVGSFVCTTLEIIEFGFPSTQTCPSACSALLFYCKWERPLLFVSLRGKDSRY